MLKCLWDYFFLMKYASSSGSFNTLSAFSALNANKSKVNQDVKINNNNNKIKKIIIKEM